MKLSLLVTTQPPPRQREVRQDAPRGPQPVLCAPQTRRFPGARWRGRGRPSVRRAGRPGSSACTGRCPRLGPAAPRPRATRGLRLPAQPRSGYPSARWAPTLGGAGASPAAQGAAGQGTAPGQLWGSARGGGAGLTPPQGAAACRGEAPGAFPDPPPPSRTGRRGKPRGPGTPRQGQGPSPGPEPRPGDGGGRGDALSRPGAEPSRSLRKVGAGEIGLRLPPALTPRPSLSRGPGPPSARRRPERAPRAPWASAPRRCRRGIPPLPREHRAGRPWREETSRRTGKLGSQWGVHGNPAAAGGADPLPWAR